MYDRNIYHFYTSHEINEVNVPYRFYKRRLQKENMELIFLAEGKVYSTDDLEYAHLLPGVGIELCFNLPPNTKDKEMPPKIKILQQYTIMYMTSKRVKAAAENIERKQILDKFSIHPQKPTEN